MVGLLGAKAGLGTRTVDTAYTPRPRGVKAVSAASASDDREALVKVTIDAERCTGHGRCYALAPEVFEPDDEGHSVLILEEIPPELEAKARIGVDNCPEQAISIVD
jgi:ferredoxin